MNADRNGDRPLELAGEIARIDRAQAEIRHLLAAQHRLETERNKVAAARERFAAEQNEPTDERIKLMAEAAKLGRDRWLAPLVVLFSALAAIGGLTTAVLSLFRIGGHG